MAQRILGNTEVKQTSDAPLISNAAKIGFAILAIAAIALAFAQIKYHAVSSLIGLAVANPIPTFIISLLVVGATLYAFIQNEASISEEDTNPEIDRRNVYTITDKCSKKKEKKSVLKKPTAYTSHSNNQTPKHGCEKAIVREEKNKNGKHVHFLSPIIAKNADPSPLNLSLAN